MSDTTPIPPGALPKKFNVRREDGITYVTLDHWRDFHAYIERMERISAYAFRGQADERWQLIPTLQRRVLAKHREELYRLLEYRHLQAFKVASRGRGVGALRLSEALKDMENHEQVRRSDDEWWAIGQHHGLATPLLDWTRSPYVALFFAAESSATDDITHRNVFALQTSLVERYCNTGQQDHSVGGRTEGLEAKEPLEGADCVRIVSPDLDDNARSIAQNGLFTHAPRGDLRGWVRNHWKGQKTGILHTIRIPMTGEERKECLRMLARMNINHATLFPDLMGAALSCNTALGVPGYSFVGLLDQVSFE